jgi:hypothetical protein
MTVREHLTKAHEAIAQHHRAMSKCHKAAIGKAEAGNPDREFHKVAAAAHDQAADAHDAMCEDCAKAVADDLNKTMPWPTGLSAVAPNAPGIRAVPRGGQPQIPARPNVPIEFSDLIKIEE